MFTNFMKYHKYEIYMKNLSGRLRSRHVRCRTDSNDEVNNSFPFTDEPKY